MQTFLQLKNKIKSRQFPTGVPISLVTAVDASFQAAMLDMQKWVPCLKQFNVSTWETADRHWENALTVVNAPYGRIRRVYAVAGGEDRWRDKVFYRSAEYPAIQCWSRRLYGATTPVNAGLPVLNFGFKLEEAAADSPYGRARIGLWAVHRKRLYIAPWLQSTETLVVEWDGEKSSWADSDGVDENYWRQDAEEAIEYYVAYRFALFFGDRAMAPGLLQMYENKRAEVKHWCREFTRQQEDHSCPAGDPSFGNVDVTSDDDDEIDDTTDEDEVLFDFVGDVEATDEGDALAAEVESDNPEFLVLGGDIGYANDNGGYAAALAAYAWAKTAGIILPVIGNHEYDGDADLSEYLSFFATELDGKNNQRYYEFVHGSVHGFVENRNSQEADGYNTTSIQDEYIIAKAFLSTARWKFVFGHQPPFSSGANYGSNPDLQRTYAAAGIHVVFSAHEHSYEHLLIGGVHYVNCGLGGRSRYNFDTPVSGSLTRYNAMETRVRVTLNCDTCLIEAINSAGVVVDSFTITHE